MILVDDTPNQPSKFKTKIWVEVNDDSHGSITQVVNAKVTFM